MRRNAPLVGAAVTTLAAMIATPLASPKGAVRRALSSVVVTGLAATTGAAMTRRWGLGRTATTAATIGVSTAVLERVGVATGLPFGRYHYTGSLKPQVSGVPAIVPMAWFAMAVPAREAAHAALGPSSTPARRVVLGAAALTAWDLFLDPQMVGEGYWVWARRGRYRGIPLSNFVGWFVASAAVMAALERLAPVDVRPQASRPLVAEYSVMAVMETVGFAVFFRDRLVASVGGAAMMPIAVAAVARRMAA